MMGFTTYLRQNLGGILLYISLAILTWRIHDYLHLLLGMEVVGFESYIGAGDPIPSILPLVFTAMVALVGAVLVARASGLLMVAGYYLILFNSTVNLLVLPRYLVPLGGPYGLEALARLGVSLPLIPLLILVSRMPRLGLKPSCAFWLSVLTLATVAGGVFLGIATWILYETGFCEPLAGMLSCGVAFDIGALLILPPATRWALARWLSD